MPRSVPLLAAAIAIAATALLPGTAAAGTPVCTKDHVDVVMRLVENTADGGAGYIEITTPDGAACTLTGFAEDVELLDDAFAPLPTVAHRDEGLPFEQVDMGEFPTVGFGLVWAADPSAPAFEVPSYLQFRLPGSETVIVEWEGGPVNADSLWIEPVLVPVS